jgi:hypothetical protein
VKESGESYEAVTIWQAQDGSQWRLAYHVKRIAGRSECVGLDIWSHPDAEHPERPLRAKTLREIDFAGRLARARRDTLPRTQRLMDLGRRLGVDVTELSVERSVMAQDDGYKTGRHARYTRDDLERAAATYRDRYADGSTSPTRETAAILGFPYNATTKLIQRCRRLGLLPPTTRGVASGSTEVDT